MNSILLNRLGKWKDSVIKFSKETKFCPFLTKRFRKESSYLMMKKVENLCFYLSIYLTIYIYACRHTRFQHAFTLCDCVFQVITLNYSSQLNNLENANVCSKRMLKTRVAIWLNLSLCHFQISIEVKRNLQDGEIIIERK